MEEQKLNPMGEWYRLVHSCDCGGKKPYKRWVMDKDGKRLFKVCDNCEERKMKAHEDSMRDNGR